MAPEPASLCAKRDAEATSSGAPKPMRPARTRENPALTKTGMPGTHGGVAAAAAATVATARQFQLKIYDPTAWCGGTHDSR